MDQREYLAAQAKLMTEDALAENCRRAAVLYGIAGWHHHDSRSSQAGFPDWVFVGTAVLYRELKRQAPRVPAHQVAAHALLAAAGADVAVWRPSDWLSGRIQAELAAIAPPGRRPVVPLGDLVPVRTQRRRVSATGDVRGRAAASAARPRLH